MSSTLFGCRISRTVFFISLALNLFFIGVCGALAWRHYFPTDGAGRGASPWTPTNRIERLASALPQPDANKLRAELQAHIGTADAANATYRAAQERMRAALRAEPFDPAAVRAAMADGRVARQKLDEVLQDVIAAASAQMSAEGRNKLADWTPYRRSGSQTNR